MADFEKEYAQCSAHGRYVERIKDGGVWRTVPRCPRCAHESKIRLVVGQAAIPERFSSRTFESYIDQGYRGQAAALATVQAYAEHFADQSKGGRGLLLIGNTGTGKTHLASAAANHLAGMGVVALYTTASDAGRRIRDTWKRNTGPSEREVYEVYALPQLLVIDEVGRVAADREILFEILDRRHQDTRPTVLLSNLPMEVTAKSQGQSLREYLGEAALRRLRESGSRAVIFDWPTFAQSVKA
jgi:DNA replication protein DnaC